MIEVIEMEEDRKFIVDGVRLDGRKKTELRPMKMEVGILNRDDGSAYVECGDNKVIASVYGPRELHPRHLQHPTKAHLRCRYNMASFSVEDRKRPGPDRRSQEISKVIQEALEPVVMLELYPRSGIDVFIEVLQADAGTRTTGINAAALALADAGIPMRNLVSACAAGKVDGEVVLDLMKDEDNYGDADMPVAMTPNGEITLIQMDGNLTEDEFVEALELSMEGCRRIYEMQREALVKRYSDISDTTEIERATKEGETEEGDEEDLTTEVNEAGDSPEDVKEYTDEIKGGDVDGE